MGKVRFCLSQNYTHKKLYYMLGTSDQFEDNGCGVDYYPAADYEALEANLREMKNSRDLEREAKKHIEAKLAALEKAAQRLVDHAQNAKQELWASLPDVINLRDVLEGKEE